MPRIWHLSFSLIPPGCDATPLLLPVFASVLSSPPNPIPTRRFGSSRFQVGIQSLLWPLSTYTTPFNPPLILYLLLAVAVFTHHQLELDLSRRDTHLLTLTLPPSNLLSIQQTATDLLQAADGFSADFARHSLHAHLRLPLQAHLCAHPSSLGRPLHSLFPPQFFFFALASKDSLNCPTLEENRHSSSFLSLFLP
jgi:hypothetical protein